MGLLDALQSASNAVAGNISGPVDLLSFLLRKAGMPVGNTPIGGSAWMEQKGLTRPVQHGMSQVLGETAGLLAPMGIAAKAPQIAKGLLQAGENVAAPRALNPQTGAIDIAALKAAFPDLDVSLSQRGDIATLDKLVVPKEKRGSGAGTEFMQALVKAADDDGARLGLTPSGDFGGSKARLVEFYRRFGFVPNKGRNKDFELMTGMIRPPL